MDNAASILLGFPLAVPFPDDEIYDQAVHVHIKKVDQLLSPKEAAVNGEEAINLLKASKPPSLLSRSLDLTDTS